MSLKLNYFMGTSSILSSNEMGHKEHESSNTVTSDSDQEISAHTSSNENNTYSDDDSSGSDGVNSQSDMENDETTERALVRELEQFLLRGLMKKQEQNHLQAVGKNLKEDSYGSEAIKEYPLFFSLLPQNPHYRGLLQSDLDEGIKECVYRSLWYTLIDLAKRTLSTTCDTHPSQIDKLMNETKSLKKLGFNVRHLVARLKQPSRLLRDLDQAKKKIEVAKKRKRNWEEIVSKEAEITRLKQKLVLLESELRIKKSMLDLKPLQSLSTAEMNLQQMEREIKSLNHQYVP